MKAIWQKRQMNGYFLTEFSDTSKKTINIPKLD
jgi:hypothetical protein